MDYETFQFLRHLALRLRGYGIIAIGLSAAFLAYTGMLVHLNDKAETDKLYQRMIPKRQ